MKKTEDYEIPEELQAFNDNPNLEEAFYKLTPGRRSIHISHFTS